MSHFPNVLQPLKEKKIYALTMLRSIGASVAQLPSATTFTLLQNLNVHCTISVSESSCVQSIFPGHVL